MDWWMIAWMLTATAMATRALFRSSRNLRTMRKVERLERQVAMLDQERMIAVGERDEARAQLQAMRPFR